MAIPTTGLVGHWQADALSLANNDPVASWTDSSGAGNHVVQATEAAKPLFKTNIFVSGLPAVLFDGVNDVLEVAISTVTTPYTIIILAQPVAISPNGSGLFSASPTGAKSFQVDFNAGSYAHRSRNNAATANVLIVIGGATAGVPAITTVIGDSSGQKTWLDGVAGGTVADPTDGLFTYFKLGANRASNIFYSGYLAEVIIYHRALTTTEREDVEAYLTAKWLEAGATLSVVAAAEATLTAASVRTGTATAAGAATMSPVSARIASSTTVAAGLATVTAIGQSVAAATGLVAAGAVTTAIGGATAAGTLSAVSAASVVFETGLPSSTLVVGGATAVEFQAGAIAAGTLASAGTATLAALVGAVAGSEIVVAGEGLFEPTAGSTAGGEFSFIGAAAVGAFSGATKSAQFSAASSASINLVGEAVSEVAVGSGGFLRRRRR